MQVYTHCLSKRWFMFMAVKEECSLVKVCLHSMQGYTHCLCKHWFMFMAVKEGCSLVKVCHLMIRCYSTPCRAIHTVLANTGSCLWQLTRHFQTVTCHVIHPHQLPPPRHLPLVLIIISYCNSMALIMNMHHCH